MLMPSVFGENLFDDLDDWFDKSFDEKFFGEKNPLYGRHARNLMKTDVKETKEGYEAEIDLPGFKKEDISVALENGYLTISAVKKADQEEKDKKTGKYIRRERYSGNLSRSFYIGEDVKQEDVKAKYEKGILKLTFPKSDQKRAEADSKIAIEG